MKLARNLFYMVLPVFNRSVDAFFHWSSEMMVYIDVSYSRQFSVNTLSVYVEADKLAKPLSWRDVLNGM